MMGSPVNLTHDQFRALDRIADATDDMKVVGTWSCMPLLTHRDIPGRMLLTPSGELHHLPKS